MSAVVIVGKILVAVGGTWIVYVTARKDRRKRRRLLDAIADARQGTVRSVGFGGAFRLSVVDGGLGVEVDVIPRSKSQTATVWRVMVPRPGTTIFKVAPGSIGSYLGTLVGAQDRELGVASFDLAYVVKTDDLAAAKRVLTFARCRHLQSAFPDAKLWSDGETVELDRPSPPSDDGDIEAGIAFVLELARVDVFGLEALRQLPGAKPWPRADRASWVEIEGPGELRVGLHSIDRRTVTRAWRTLDDTARFSSFDIVDGRCQDDAQLPASVRARIREVGTARFEVSATTVEIRWPTIEDDPGRLAAAIEVLRRLDDGPSFGAFR